MNIELDNMLYKLEYFVRRFEEAWKSFKNPDRIYEEHDNGRDIGEIIAFAKVRQQFDNYDPHDIGNQHFQMGYYYAVSQAKKVMNLDEDNSVGEA